MSAASPRLTGTRLSRRCDRRELIADADLHFATIRPAGSMVRPAPNHEPGPAAIIHGSGSTRAQSADRRRACRHPAPRRTHPDRPFERVGAAAFAVENLAMARLMAPVKTGSMVRTFAMFLRPRELLLAAVTHVAAWRDRARQRRLLAQLTDRELRDIGLTRYDALEEWRKPFWRE
jgi:uncharacterized protein YjiS (DUF1127 family)